MSGFKGNTRTPVQNTAGTGVKLSAKILAVYNRMLLERAVDSQLFDIGAQVRTIPAGSNTKKAFAYRYKNLLPATTKLAELKIFRLHRLHQIN